MPEVDANSAVGLELANAADRLAAVGPGFGDRPMLDPRQRADVRAEIDAIVAAVYSLTPQEFELILNDFPLLDRKQPAPVTRDLAMRAFLRRLGRSVPAHLEERVARALSLGSVAYVPSEQVRLGAPSLNGNGFSVIACGFPEGKLPVAGEGGRGGGR